MALYKNGTYLSQSTDAAFDSAYTPGTAAPLSGIYRCDGCGREVASNENQPLPPQNHHQHTTQQGVIKWRLLVYADHRGR